MRHFSTGATRDQDVNKLDYEGFFSPLVLKRRAEYMHHNRIQADGKLRASDNWQKGMPKDAYIKSAFRHFLDWWTGHRGHVIHDSLEDVICAVMFNCEGYLHEMLKAKNPPPAIDITEECNAWQAKHWGVPVTSPSHVPCAEVITGSNQFREFDTARAKVQ